jgi:hypothetical protein
MPILGRFYACGCLYVFIQKEEVIESRDEDEYHFRICF